MNMKKFVITITLISLLAVLSPFASTMTLDAGTGEGPDNDFNTGGTDVGTDCSETGGTAAYTTTKSDLLDVPIENHVGGVGTIAKITVRLYAKADINLSGTSEGIQVRIELIYDPLLDGTVHELNTSYAYYSADFTEKPGGGAWTWTDIDDVRCGCKAVASGGVDWSQIDVDHLEVIVTYTGPPTLVDTNTAESFTSATCFQRTDGSGDVEMNYRISDDDYSDVTIKAEYWNGSAFVACTDATLTGEGSVNADNPGTNRQLIWDAATQLATPTEVSNYNMQIIAVNAIPLTDTLKFSSNNFVIDTKDPTGWACSTPTIGSSPGGPDVTLTSATASDASTISYYLEIDTDSDCSSPIANSGWQSADPDWVATGLSVSQTYYWRVKVKDFYGNETAYSSIYNFTVSNVKPSVVIDNVTHATNGTGLVTVQYDLSDPQAPENCELLIEYSADNSTYYQAYISSASVGTIDNTGVSGGTATRQIHTISTNQSNVTFVWDSQNGSNETDVSTTEDATFYIRITPKDASANTGNATTSTAFVLDNADPTGYGCSSPSDAATNTSIQPVLTSSTASDISTIEYYIELDDADPFVTAIANSGWQSGATWQTSELAAGSTYSWRVNARDSYGNTGTVSSDYSFTTGSALWISGVISPCTSPVIGDGVVYVGAQQTIYSYDIDNGTEKWSYDASGAQGGFVTNLCLYYHSAQGKYAIYYTNHKAQIGAVWDNGSSAESKFDYVDWGTATDMSDPILSTDGDYLYLTFNGDSYKVSTSDGGIAWTIESNSPIATSSAIVEASYVYFPVTGNVEKYAVDNTYQSSNAHAPNANISLNAWSDIMYVASNDNYVYAVNLSTMGTAWTSDDLLATTTSAAFRQGVYIYVGAGTNLKKMNSSDGSVAGTYSTPANTINSMPVVTSAGTAFFGDDDGEVYAVDVATMAAKTGWPKTAGGTIPNSPTVDVANGVVVFTSNEGKVYAYPVP